jgi:hypothetical protein
MLKRLLSFLMLTMLALPVVGQTVATSYTFSSTTGTYTPITGGTVLGDATTDDQRIVDPAVPLGTTTTSTGPGFPIGFNFWYGGRAYDRFGVQIYHLRFLQQLPTCHLISEVEYLHLAET